MTDCDTVSQLDSGGGDISDMWPKCHPPLQEAICSFFLRSVP
jgi:hypothetical protein